MSTIYVPGQPNPYFTKHPCYGIAIGQNMQPIYECRTIDYVDASAKSKKGLQSFQLGPRHLWRLFQREAEKIISVGGQMIEDHKLRNRRINAAYAQLWLADHRFQWAGLAAFASKQVGCGLLHARQLAEKSRDEVREQMRFAGSSSEAATMSVMPMMIEPQAYDMEKRMGEANKHLFLDIYPLHRFYMERGPDEFLNYLAERQAIEKEARWDVGHQLKFGYPFKEMRTGFEQIRDGKIAESVKRLAWHEQVNVLQAILYNDTAMQRALARNQFAWAINFPTGVYMEIQLTLSAQCRPKPGLTTFFSRKKTPGYGTRKNGCLLLSRQPNAFMNC